MVNGAARDSTVQSHDQTKAPSRLLLFLGHTDRDLDCESASLLGHKFAAIKSTGSELVHAPIDREQLASTSYDRLTDCD